MEIIQAFITKDDSYQKNVNNADSRYMTFQKRGPLGLMLHSVGCNQPSAEVFAKRWNAPGRGASVHAFVQADGKVYQIMPWNFRAWHCGGAANDTHVGVEMTEPDCITYISGSRFTCSNLERARAQVRGTYNTAVELFAKLCKQYRLDPLKDIISHYEGSQKGVASDHGDPEHLWRGLSMGYTMDGFRKAVKATMEEDDMTREQTMQLINDAVKPLNQQIQALVNTVASFSKDFPELWEERYKAKMKSLSDNDSGKWSEEARQWAIENGLILGVGTLPDGTPNYAWEQPLTREQYVTVEYRQATQKEDVNG